MSQLTQSNIDHSAEIIPPVSQVENGVREIVAEILRMQDRPMEIKPSSNLFELGLESLNVIELLTAIEMGFDITIDVEDLSGELFESFGALVDFVTARRENP